MRKGEEDWASTIRMIHDLEIYTLYIYIIIYIPTLTRIPTLFETASP